MYIKSALLNIYLQGRHRLDQDPTSYHYYKTQVDTTKHTRTTLHLSHYTDQHCQLSTTHKTHSDTTGSIYRTFPDQLTTPSILVSTCARTTLAITPDLTTTNRRQTTHVSTHPLPRHQRIALSVSNLQMALKQYSCILKSYYYL